MNKGDVQEAISKSKIELETHLKSLSKHNPTPVDFLTKIRESVENDLAKVVSPGEAKAIVADLICEIDSNLYRDDVQTMTASIEKAVEIDHEYIIRQVSGDVDEIMQNAPDARSDHGLDNIENEREIHEYGDEMEL